MNTLKLIGIGMMLLLSFTVKAQLSVHVNIGTPPPWGPTGYAESRYYYLPDIEAYYDIQNSMYIYNEGGVWVHRGYLPQRYRNYDLYGGYKVVMTDYHGDAPYAHFNEHRMKYGHGYRGAPQRTYHERPGGGRREEDHGHDRGRGEQHDNREEHGHDKGRGEQHDNRGHQEHGDHGHDR